MSTTLAGIAGLETLDRAEVLSEYLALSLINQVKWLFWFHSTEVTGSS